MQTYRLGLIVNPIAGMGGAAGLKGTDRELAEKARTLGAVPLAGRRAAAALSQLADLGDRLALFTCSGTMGAAAAQASGLPAQVASVVQDGPTSAADTQISASRILKQRPDLLLFAGGDGTARDLLEVLGQRVPMLGVPCGVKMHSATFAATPRAAGEVVRRYLLAADRGTLLRDAEILDREASSATQDRLSPKLYGMARTPCLSFLVPGAKSSSGASEQAALLRHGPLPRPLLRPAGGGHDCPANWPSLGRIFLFRPPHPPSAHRHRPAGAAEICLKTVLTDRFAASMLPP